MFFKGPNWIFLHLEQVIHTLSWKSSAGSHLTVSQRPTAMPHPGTRFSLQHEIQTLSTHRSTTRSGVIKVPLGRCITHWIPSSLSSFQMTIALSLTCTSCTPATSCLWWSSQCSAMQSSRAGLAKFDRSTQISVQKRWPCLQDKWWWRRTSEPKHIGKGSEKTTCCLLNPREGCKKRKSSVNALLCNVGSLQPKTFKCLYLLCK